MKSAYELAMERLQKNQPSMALTEDQKKEQLKVLHVKNRQQMKAILTPEQQQKVAEQRKNLRKQHQPEVKRK